MDGLGATLFDDFRPALRLGIERPSLLTARRMQRRHNRLRVQPTDRLFLAALPTRETAERIAHLARHLRIGHELKGKPIETEHFHVTLYHVGDAVGAPPSQLIEAVTERAADLMMPQFRVAFDRVMSFRNGAFVLSGSDGVIGLDILQQRLCDVLDWQPRLARPFTPHLTLLRDNQRVAEHPIEPISWTVRDVVLVHSVLGRTTRRHLARVPLG